MLKQSLTLLLSITLLFTSCREQEPAEEEFIYAKNGRLYFPNGEELALWGVNLQPCLSWEYNGLFKRVGLPLDADILKNSTNNALDEIQKLNADLIRAHLVPSDFTDNEGNLVETIYLDLLDYMVAEASNRGIYVYLTFLNPHMSNKKVIPDSFITEYDSKELYCNPAFIEKSKVYIQQLLNRKNPYLKIKYKDTPAVALWEIANEPDYYSYEEVKDTSYYQEFLSWAKQLDLEDTQDSYFKYRHNMVLNYINTMYDAIRDTGAVQPIVWNCNWHKMIRGREDVFDAIAESKVEVVSFCNYPGQSILKKPYYRNPEDLSRHEFSSFLRDSYEQEDWYRWALRPDFMKKAKVVYEFETFYNYSGYLYPAQAEFFRAMGVQSATMWHYSMPDYAHYRNGSHHLSLTSTPHKAASFAIAGEVFRSTPLYSDFDPGSPVEKVSDNIMYSYEKDLSIYSSNVAYMHAGPVPFDELPGPKDGITKILGYGNSPLVEYDGKGIYSINISGDEMTISIQPDAHHLKPLWEKDYLVEPVTRLDHQTMHTFELELDGWGSQACKLYRVEGDNMQEVPLMNLPLIKFEALPGDYLIIR